MNALTNPGVALRERHGRFSGAASNSACLLSANRSDVTDLSDSELLANTHTLLGTQRRLTARLIGRLAEIEERRLHLKAACSSMFDFCTRRLGMSEGEAFRRIAAARLSRRFPVVSSLVETGVVHLSALALAQHHLTDENHAELLREISGKSKRAVAELLARRFPKPDAPSVMRKLPTQRESMAGSGTPGVGAGTLLDRAQRIPDSRPAARIEPLSEARYKVQFTASGVLKDKIERAQNLLRHKKPNGDLAVVMERAVDALLAELEKSKLGETKRPRTPRAPHTRSSDPGAVSRRARREVFARDGEQCSFVDAEGRRCSGRAFLEIEHVDPRACGGSGGSQNLKILCRAHNRLAAEQVFGRRYIERAIGLRKRKRRNVSSDDPAPPSVHLRQHNCPPSNRERHHNGSPSNQERQHLPLQPPVKGPAHEQTAAPVLTSGHTVVPARASDRTAITEKLVGALVHLGFRPGPARHALDVVRGEPIAGEREPSLPELLRTAILLLTR